ncbi:MAG: glycosyltransferase family 1 protein, partial [Casimicrobiaceae bacterium]
MKIAIDLQACQTPGSRRRGIGRYSLELAKGILRNRGPHRVHLLLNHAFRDHDDALKAELGDGNGVSFETYRLLPVDGVPRARRKELQRINDEILGWRYACCGADVLHVSSVFEAWAAPGAHVDARIADVPGVLRSATLYDLIPLLFADAYLAPASRADYIATLGVFQQIDLILAISESARRDAIAKLDILPERIVNVGAAVSGAFRRLESIDAGASRETLRRHGLRSRFVLYTGAADPRKNVDFLLRAYAALPAQLRAEVQLAIVSGLHDAERQALAQRAAALGIENDVALIGYVPDEDLNLLYNACDLFVLPSLYEGFGLPLLEAMTCGACVIASNASSLPEIVGCTDVLFDPTEHAALTRMMRDLLGAPERRRELGAASLVRSRQFSWDNVG